VIEKRVRERGAEQPRAHSGKTIRGATQLTPEKRTLRKKERTRNPKGDGALPRGRQPKKLGPDLLGWGRRWGEPP